MSKKDKKEAAEETVEKNVEPKCETEEKAKADADAAEAKTVSETDQLKNQMNELEKEVNKWKNDYYKVFADMENLKRRLKTEHENAMKFMMQDFATDLLPVVDNLDRALSQETTEENQAFVKGMEMIRNQFMEILKKHGVEEIEALGKEFDPNYHQAVMMTSEEGVPSNIITEELQKGYKLKDRVLRASLVKVNE